MTETLQIVRGSEFRTAFAWTDAAGSARAATDASVSAHLRHPWGQERRAITVVTAWTDEDGGIGEISMDETQTALIPLGAITELVIEVVRTGIETDIFVGGIVEGL